MIFGQKQQKYAFILGHCPALSKAEVIRVLEHENISFQPVFSNQSIFVIETNGQLKVNELQEKLGGTIKISRIKYYVLRIKLEEVVRGIIIKRLKDLKINNQKFQFGFSLYGQFPIKEFYKIGLSIKKQLANQGIRSRFIVAKEPSLSSVIVQKEGLIEAGADIVIIQADNQYYVGYTLTAQRFAEYSGRDYGRPRRDDKSGLLPPKLAKIMLNISQTGFNQTILDPFCGSGTTIQEALLLGYKNIIGTDISDKAVSDSQNNINWLKTKYGLDVSGVKIFQQDVRNLAEKIPAESVDVIVTEPYLGPSRYKEQPTLRYRSGQANSKQITNFKYQILNTLKELEDLYLQAFAEFHKVLKKNGKVVIVFPVIDGKRLEILEQIKSIEFKIEPLSDELRQSIIYSREGQNVLREIFVFRKM